MAATAPINEAAPNAPYYTPIQSPPAGTALSANPPTLFTPLKLRSQTFQNRIWVSPMAMYSSPNGYLTDLHLMHLGAFAYRGASLTIIEATAVQPEGRVTPQDAGLWEDGQVAPIRRIADLVHSQGQKLGLQLGHGGRKCSVCAPWLMPSRGARVLATEEAGGWPANVKSISPGRWGPGYATPQEMTRAELHDVVVAFADAARRAVAAGVDVIEIHAAHGYLLHSALSPLTNQRTDEYGGSFENRARLLVETLRAVRAVLPPGMPLSVRISATDWVDDGRPSWDVPQSIRLAKLLPALGVDLLDVSSGGNDAAQKIPVHTDFQIGIAGRIRAALHQEGITDLAVACVGMINEAEIARDAVQKGGLVSAAASEVSKDDATVHIEDEQGKPAQADVVLVARQFLREPEWVLKIARRLGVDVKWPIQYHMATYVKGVPV
ncbi:MAG: hypothetical protein M1818_004960 [Claussenomyces sp. TS43310]|nr:MAG: hypothetical protein M1818_004960 [Claussenomyces sp. TS43310]